MWKKKDSSSLRLLETKNDFERYFGLNLALEMRIAMSKVIKKTEKE